MKTKTFFYLSFTLMALLFTSCESDSDDDTNGGADNNNITVSIDEYPRTGDLVTTLNSSLAGDLSYSIISVSLNSAVALFGNELRVEDWLLFDFESIEQFTVDIEVSNGTETELLNYVVEINDVDDIAAFLNGDSRTAYDSANNGEWVMILESEYNDIANYLADTSKSATTDSDMISNANTFSLQSGVTYANDNGQTLPANDYFIGFKYYSWANNASNVRVKISESDVSGPYQDVGDVLPDHDSGFNHFIFKGNSTRLDNTSYLAIYSSVNIGGKNKNDFGFKRENGNVDNLDGQGNNGFVLYQGLSSSLKQWD